MIITTTKHLPTEPEDLVLFAKAKETFTAEQLLTLLTMPSVSIELVENRDDMLVCLGAILADGTQAKILDPGIPIPKRFAGQIEQVVEKKPRKRRKKKEVFIGMNPPEPPEKEEAPESGEKQTEQKDAENEKEKDAEKETPVFQFPETERLYALINLTSKEAGFSWPTEMLMIQIMNWISDTDEDMLEERMKIERPIVWEKIKGHLDEIRQLAKDFENS